MNKFFLFPVFAVFALIACSDEPKPTHAELCAKKPITRECLIGKWLLEGVEGQAQAQFCDHNGGDLNLKADGKFFFEGGIYNIEINGSWELNEGGATMKIICPAENGNCGVPDIPSTINADIEIHGRELRIFANGYASFSRCGAASSVKFAEVFSWQGY